MRSRLWIGFGLALVTSHLLLAQAVRLQPERTFIHERDMYGRFIMDGRFPVWTGTVLLGVEGRSMSSQPLIYSVDRDGKREEIWFKLPDSRVISLYSISGGADGAIAVCGSAIFENNVGAGFVAWISPDRKHQTVSRVWPYSPQKLVIAADGTMWTVGTIWLDDRKRVFNVLRRFDRSGKELASFRLRARSDAIWPENAVDYSLLVASRDRVGWFTRGCEYIEFSLGGVELGRFDGPVAPDDISEVSGVALNEANELFVCKWAKGTWQILVLNRQTRSWRAASPEESGYNHLLGFDGDALVTIPRTGPGGVLRWFKPVNPSPTAPQ